ncbi:MAG TPA: response regulator transcription factor [Pirellulaceae bacterium]|nr:response regulator transcription factor [Pirellulaceae bacterium]
MTDQRIKVLIADDNDHVRTILSRVMSRQSDLRVLGAVESGEKACEAAACAKPDVLLMDVRMDGMGGVEAAEWVTSHVPGVSVIGMSALESDAAVEAMRDAGAVDFVPKLASMDHLVQSIRAATAMARLLPAP